MEIFIRTQSLETGNIAWWHKDEYQSYLFDSPTLWATSSCTGDEFLAGTPFKSVKEARREARQAKFMAEFDGENDIKVTFWTLSKNGNPTQVQVTRDNKVVKKK